MKINDVNVDIYKVCGVYDNPIFNFKDMSIISCEWFELPRELRKMLVTDVLFDYDPAFDIDHEIYTYAADIIVVNTNRKTDPYRAFLYAHRLNTDVSITADEARELVKYLCGNTFSYISYAILPLNLSAREKNKIVMLLNDHDRFSIIDLDRTIIEDAEMQEAEAKKMKEALAKKVV